MTAASLLVLLTPLVLKWLIDQVLPPRSGFDGLIAAFNDRSSKRAITWLQQLSFDGAPRIHLGLNLHAALHGPAYGIRDSRACDPSRDFRSRHVRSGLITLIGYSGH
jgi:hypothetical protein